MNESTRWKHHFTVLLKVAARNSNQKLVSLNIKQNTAVFRISNKFGSFEIEMVSFQANSNIHATSVKKDLKLKATSQFI